MEKFFFSFHVLNKQFGKLFLNGENMLMQRNM